MIRENQNYDPLAWFYHKYWDYAEISLSILRKLLLSRLRKGDRILDLCCGTGHLARALASLGFEITGIDNSEDMLQYARKRVPRGNFLSADAREFRMPSRFNAVVSTLDSMNHILSLDELEIVFSNVLEALVNGGYFLFDLNTEEAYRTQWQKSSFIIKDDNVCIIHGGYKPNQKLGVTNLVLFSKKEEWKRVDVRLYQRCYSGKDITVTLKKAGFQEIASYDAKKDLKMRGRLSIGRAVFLAKKVKYSKRVDCME